MIIETQNTPDPEVINFFPPVPVIKGSAAEFVEAKSLRKSPLAEKLFDLGYIKSIFITAEMISITKESNISWDDLRPLVLAEIMEYLATGQEAVISEENVSSDADVISRIKGLLNARIRPAVRQDGGDIVFRDFKNGVVEVEMQGHCVGCPYAMVTLKEGVEKILKAYIPEVKSVKNYEKVQDRDEKK